VRPAGLEAAEAAVLERIRWWSLAELRASDELFAPRRLAPLLGELLAGRLPAAPVATGI